MKNKDIASMFNFIKEQTEIARRIEITVAIIQEKQSAIADKMDLSTTWQKEHEAADEERFASLNKFAASIAIVSSAVGACAIWVWNKITGQA